MPATLVAEAQMVPAVLRNGQTILYQVYYQYIPNHLKENKCILNYCLGSNNHDILDLTLQNQLYCITNYSLRQAQYITWYLDKLNILYKKIHLIP